MAVPYHIVIPARMASERLPGKPLLDIGGLSLIEHVFRRARESAAASVCIATDDNHIRAAAERFGAEVVMTSPQHASGSDRVAECLLRLGLDDRSVVVNLQGDEPLMPPACLDQVAELLAADASAAAASLYWLTGCAAEISDPNVVKVVTGQDGSALCFSRSVLPYPRNAGGLDAALAAGAKWKRHIGLYAWRAGALRTFAATPPGALENQEKLEQLRVLENGGRIVMALACAAVPAGVDTPEDLERVRRIIREKSK